jgi:hypothetical protein
LRDIFFKQGLAVALHWEKSSLLADGSDGVAIQFIRLLPGIPPALYHRIDRMGKGKETLPRIAFVLLLVLDPVYGR